MLCCTIAVVQVAFLTIKLDVLLTVVRLFCSLLIRIAIKSDLYHRSFCRSTSHWDTWNRVQFKNEDNYCDVNYMSHHDLTYSIQMVAIIHDRVHHVTSAFVQPAYTNASMNNAVLLMLSS